MGLPKFVKYIIISNDIYFEWPKFGRTICLFGLNEYKIGKPLSIVVTAIDKGWSCKRNQVN